MNNKEGYFNIAISEPVNEGEQSWAEIDVYGIIGEDPFAENEDQNTKENIKSKLDKIRGLEVDKIKLNVSSIGGSTDDAFVIYDLLRNHEAEVETNITGYTASSGTIISMAGDKITMSENALFLIHRSHSIGIGNRYDLEKLAKDLQATDERISNIYAKRGGKEQSFYMNWMDKENGNGVWLDADQVKDELGLIDSINRNEMKKAAMVTTEQLNKAGLPIPENKKGIKEEKKTAGKEITFTIDASDLIITNEESKEEISNTEKTDSQAEKRQRELYIVTNNQQ